MPHFLAFSAPLGEKSNIRQISTHRLAVRNEIILGERFEEPQAVSELRVEFGCEGRGRRPSAVRNGIIHRLRFEKALQLLTKRMESLAAELHCLSAARHEFAIQPKDYK